MKDISAKETKRRELSYKATQDLLKSVGIMPAPHSPLVANIYNDNRIILNPIIAEILRSRGNETIDLDNPQEEQGDND